MKRQNNIDELPVNRSIKRKPELIVTNNFIASSTVGASAATDPSVHRTLMRICQTNLLLQQQVPETNYRFSGATTATTTSIHPVQPQRMQSVQSSLIASSHATALVVQNEPSNVLNHHEYENFRDTLLPTFIFSNNGIVRDTVLNQSDVTQRCHTDNELLRVAILHQQEIERTRAATLSTIRPILSGMANGISRNQIHRLHERLTPTSDTRWSSIIPNPSPEESLAIQHMMYHFQPTSIPYPTLSTNSTRVIMTCPRTALSINNFGTERGATNILSHGAQSITMNRSHFTTTTTPFGAIPPQQLSSITTRLVLPSCVAQPIDVYKISAHQCLLREQMEYFAATENDVQIHVRGRNKAITVGQVGIRCKHCAHVPISKRQKGSTYFPSNKLGIYQAAQNMSTTHIQCGLCTCTPDRIKDQFVTIMTERQRNENGAGRPYWAQSATHIGLINTAEHGIRFLLDRLPPEICVVPD